MIENQDLKGQKIEYFLILIDTKSATTIMHNLKKKQVSSTVVCHYLRLASQDLGKLINCAFKNTSTVYQIFKKKKIY